MKIKSVLFLLALPLFAAEAPQRPKITPEMLVRYYKTQAALAKSPEFVDAQKAVQALMTTCGTPQLAMDANGDPACPTPPPVPVPPPGTNQPH